MYIWDYLIIIIFKKFETFLLNTRFYILQNDKKNLEWIRNIVLKVFFELNKGFQSQLALLMFYIG